MPNWEVRGEIRDRHDRQPFPITGLDTPTHIGNCKIESGGEGPYLFTQVSGGGRAEASRTAGKEFANIILSVNLSTKGTAMNSTVFVNTLDPNCIPESELNPATTIECLAEGIGVRDIDFVEEERISRDFAEVEVGDVTYWNEVYRRAGERDKRRLKDVVRGLRLLTIDEDMAFLYGQRVIEDILNEEYKSIRKKNYYSKGRIRNGLIPDIETAFDNANMESKEVDEAIEVLRNHVSHLPDFPKKEMVKRLAEESGFYDSHSWIKDEVKQIRLRSYATNYVPKGRWEPSKLAVSAFYGDEEARKRLSKFDVDVDEVITKLREREEEAEKEARREMERTIEIWEERFEYAPHFRDEVAHRLSNSEETRERMEFIVHFAQFLVEQSIKGELRDD